MIRDSQFRNIRITLVQSRFVFNYFVFMYINNGGGKTLICIGTKIFYFAY